MVRNANVIGPLNPGFPTGAIYIWKLAVTPAYLAGTPLSRFQGTCSPTTGRVWSSRRARTGSATRPQTHPPATAPWLEQRHVNMCCSRYQQPSVVPPSTAGGRPRTCRCTTTRSTTTRAPSPSSGRFNRLRLQRHLLAVGNLPVLVALQGSDDSELQSPSRRTTSLPTTPIRAPGNSWPMTRGRRSATRRGGPLPTTRTAAARSPHDRNRALCLSRPSGLATTHDE